MTIFWLIVNLILKNILNVNANMLLIIFNWDFEQFRIIPYKVNLV